MPCLGLPHPKVVALTTQGRKLDLRNVEGSTDCLPRRSVDIKTCKLHAGKDEKVWAALAAVQAVQHLSRSVALKG